MSFDLAALLRNPGGLGRVPGENIKLDDTSEMVYISSMALIKMMKHARAGVPMEVMGLMLGTIVDDYAVTVVDVFAMPQNATGVTVEAVDPIFQQQMIDMLQKTGRSEMVVGWYHSHPGFGCWLSSVDLETQKSFETVNRRCLAVVVDPIQSVKGKVVIDCFRRIDDGAMISMAKDGDSRQVTSNIGHLNKPSPMQSVRGLNRFYYSLPIRYTKNDLENQMLLSMNKKSWVTALELASFTGHSKSNKQTVKDMHILVNRYQKSVEHEEKLSTAETAIVNIGKQDPKRHLEETVHKLMADNIIQAMISMADAKSFGGQKVDRASK